MGSVKLNFTWLTMMCVVESFVIIMVQVEALVGALLFAVHPVHTEAVAGIVGQVSPQMCCPSKHAHVIRQA